MNCKWLRVGLTTLVVSVLTILVPLASVEAAKPPPPPPPPAVTYTMTLLPLPAGSLVWNVRGMNARGDVIGSALFLDPSRATDNGGGYFERPVVWLANGVTWTADAELGDVLATMLSQLDDRWPANPVWGIQTVPNSDPLTVGAVRTVYGIHAYAINDQGQICGNANFRRAIWDGVTWNNTVGLAAAFRYTPPSEGVIENVELIYRPEGASSIAVWAMNNDGDVVGTVSLSQQSPFVWRATATSPEILESTGGNSSASAINDAGQVTGWMYVNGVQHAFRHDLGTGTTLDLGVLGSPKPSYSGEQGPWSRGWSINNNGQVVGQTTVAGIYYARAFRYTDGQGMVQLGVLSGTTSSGSLACAINNRGQVIGKSWNYQKLNNPTRAQFLYTDQTGMVSLWSLITSPPTGITADDFADRYADATSVVDINDYSGHSFGQICGTTYTSGLPYVLTPDK